MNIPNPNSTPMTVAEADELARLKALIDLAVEDGKITRSELNAIRSAALADGKLTAEECALLSSMILEKVKTGEIRMEW